MAEDWEIETTTMVTRHKIISATSTDKLEQELNNWVDDGWEIHGDIQLAMSGDHTRHSVLLKKQVEREPDFD